MEIWEIIEAINFDFDDEDDILPDLIDEDLSGGEDDGLAV